MVAIFAPPAAVHSAEVTLSWDPVVHPSLAGYKIHQGTSSQHYTRVTDVGNVTEYTCKDLQEDTTYYFSASTYDVNGSQSDLSNEVSFQPSISPAISRHASLSPSCVQGANASSQTFQISNSGSGTLTYSISDDATWLSCGPSSGTSTGEQDTITVSYATSALSAGSFSATITIAATGASTTPQTISVHLTVNAPAPAISRNPACLS